jgi:hypothetical protein
MKEVLGYLILVGIFGGVIAFGVKIIGWKLTLAAVAFTAGVTLLSILATNLINGFNI